MLAHKCLKCNGATLSTSHFLIYLVLEEKFKKLHLLWWGVCLTFKFRRHDMVWQIGLDS